MADWITTSVEIGGGDDVARAPMIVSEYLRDYYECLDASRFPPIPGNNGAIASPDERGEERTERSGARLERWRHRARSGMFSLL